VSRRFQDKLPRKGFRYRAKQLHELKRKHENTWDSVEALLLLIALGLTFYGADEAARAAWEWFSRAIVGTVLAVKVLSYAAWRIAERYH